MNFRAFRYYETVVVTGGVRAAAEVLFVAPSTVIREIQRLEQELDAGLLERNALGEKPTKEGKILLQHIQTLRREDDSLRSRIDDLKKLKSGEICIAMGGEYSADFISSALDAFCKLYSGITFDLSLSSTDKIIQKVHNNEVDIGLVFDPYYDQHIESLNICCQPLYLITYGDDERFSEDFPVSFSDLINDRFVFLHKNFGVRKLIMRCQAELGVDLNMHLECNSFEIIKLYVQQGLGLSLLPKFCVWGEIRRGDLKAVPLFHETLNSMSSHVIVRQGRSLPKAVKVFSQFLIQEMDACH